MKCKGIIIKYLKDNGYDGLCNTEIPCGCGINDLASCGWEDVRDCQPAYADRNPDCKNCRSKGFCDGFPADMICYKTKSPKTIKE